MNKKNYLFIISAPSGGGKTSLIKRMLAEDEQLTCSISYTTRDMRPDEINGKDYIFVKDEEFQSLVKNNHFLEYAKVFNNYYGTSEKSIIDQFNLGKDVLLEIDWQGAREIRKKFENVISIYVIPPDLKSLKERLIKRSQDSLTIIEKRMAQAKAEIIHYDEYDYVIINDKFERSLKQIKSIINSVRLNIKNEQPAHSSKIKKILNSDI